MHGLEICRTVKESSNILSWWRGRGYLASLYPGGEKGREITEVIPAPGQGIFQNSRNRDPNIMMIKELLLSTRNSNSLLGHPVKIRIFITLHQLELWHLNTNSTTKFWRWQPAGKWIVDNRKRHSRNQNQNHKLNKAKQRWPHLCAQTHPVKHSQHFYLLKAGGFQGKEWAPRASLASKSPELLEVVS